jgi:transcriptional regulator with XRE-family HTH domain
MYSIKPTPIETAKILAEKFRSLRKQQKLSQEEMAESSGVSLGSLKRFEQTGKISLISLLKLTHLMGRLEDFDNLLLPGKNLDTIKKLFST